MKTLALTSLIAVLMSSTAQAQLGGVAETAGAASQQLEVSRSGLSGQTDLSGSLRAQPGLSRIEQARLDRAERAARRAARAAANAEANLPEANLPEAEAPAMPDVEAIAEARPEPADIEISRLTAPAARAEALVETVPEAPEVEVQTLSAPTLPARAEVAVPAPRATVVQGSSRPAYVSRETVVYTEHRHRDLPAEPAPAETRSAEIAVTETRSTPAPAVRSGNENRSGPVATGERSWFPLACGASLIALLLALAALLGRRKRRSAA